MEGKLTPQLVICHKCGITLYEREELKPLDEIIQGYDCSCPSCNKRLCYQPKNVEVNQVSVPNRINPFEPEKEKSSRTESGARTKRRTRKTGVYVSSRARSGGKWGTE